MEVNTNNQINNISFQLDGQVREKNPGKVFEQFYNAAVELINETNQNQLNADKIQVDFATGRTDNVLAVVLAQEKAATTLNFTVQVTNKLIDTYREIMRIQV